MPIDPKLLIKAAKVYEAAEPVEGEKPKEVYESHKQCAPGEFGMNKEGAGDIGNALMHIPYDAAVVGGLGSLVGAAGAKPGKRLRGAGRGFARGAGMGVGGNVGALAGLAAGYGLGGLVPGDDATKALAQKILGLTGGGVGLAGGLYGGYQAGGAAADALGLKDDDKEEKKEKQSAQIDSNGRLRFGPEDLVTGGAIGLAASVPAAVYAYQQYKAKRKQPHNADNKNDNPEEKQSAHEKSARIPLFGGRNYSLAPRGFGVGLKGGYNFLGGVVPNPYVGVDVGTPHTGLSVSGPLPALGLRSGFFSRPPGATSHHNRHGLFGHRSLWGYLNDMASAKTTDDIDNDLVNDKLQSLQHVTKDELHEAVPHYHTGEDGKPLSKKMHGALVNYYHEKSRPDSDKDTPKKDKKMKKESAYVFGALVKQAIDPALGYGAAGGGLLGAGLGGLAGFINPGEEEDEDGRMRQRSRFGAALRGALGGGAVGAAGGAALGHFSPNSIHSLMGMFGGANSAQTPAQRNMAANVAKMTPAQQQQHARIMNAAPRKSLAQLQTERARHMNMKTQVPSDGPEIYFPGTPGADGYADAMAHEDRIQKMTEQHKN